MFVWGAVSHLVLFKGTGFSRLPNEDRIVTELRGARYGRRGSTSFQALISAGTRRPKRRQPGEAKFSAGPTGMIVYHPEEVLRYREQLLIRVL